jgi:hypothetical protein
MNQPGTSENVFVHSNAFNDSIAATIDFTIEKTCAKAKLTVAPAIATKISSGAFRFNQSEPISEANSVAAHGN